MNQVIDLTGQKFHYLTVIKANVERATNGSVLWKCRCKCGNIVDVRADRLRSSRTKSCGCFRRESLTKRETKEVTYEENSSGCWICTSHCVDGSSYIHIKRDGKKYLLHRYIYEKCKGPIPDGYVVRHTCDNPQCVKPDHLITGSHKDNSEDMVRRDRQAKGDSSPQSKLTESDVRLIRQDITTSNSEFAEVFNTKPATIYNVRKRKTWKHVK